VSWHTPARRLQPRHQQVSRPHATFAHNAGSTARRGLWRARLPCCYCIRLTWSRRASKVCEVCMLTTMCFAARCMEPGLRLCCQIHPAALPPHHTTPHHNAVQDGHQGQLLGSYQGAVHAIRTMLRHEGWRAFYNGLLPAWLGSGVVALLWEVLSGSIVQDTRRLL
jgi:hypothetical protein